MKKILIASLLATLVSPAAYASSFLDQLNQAMKQQASQPQAQAPSNPSAVSTTQPPTDTEADCLAKHNGPYCEAQAEEAARTQTVQAQHERQIKQAAAQKAEEGLPPIQNGLWTDPATHLTWMVCPLGSKWTGTGCDLTTARFGHWTDMVALLKQSTYGGITDWRLPTVSELTAVVSMCPASQPTKLTENTKTGTVPITQYCHGAPNPRVFKYVLDILAQNNYVEIGPLWTSSQAKDDDKCLYFYVGDRLPRCTRIDRDGRDSSANIIAVRGGSYDEYSETLRSVAAALNQDAQNEALFQADLIKERKAADARDAAQFQAQQQMIKHLDQKDKALRESVKAGDEVIIVIEGQAHRALVLAVNDKLVSVQTEDDVQQRWVKRGQLYAIP